MELVPNDALDKELARYLAEAPAGLKPLLKRVTTEHPCWDGVNTKRVREAMARLATAASSHAPAPLPAPTPAPPPRLEKRGQGKIRNKRVTNTDARSNHSAVPPARKRDEMIDEFQRMVSLPRNRLECAYIPVCASNRASLFYAVWEITTVGLRRKLPRIGLRTMGEPDTVHGALPYAFTHALMHMHEHARAQHTHEHAQAHISVWNRCARTLGSRLLIAAGSHRTFATISEMVCR